VDRVGVFVDAGYLLGEGGFACLGTRKRGEIACDYGALAEQLATLAQRGCGLPVLRIYWYDAAPRGVPLTDQLRVAELRNVKLRLGRLIGTRQKGVDSLIVRDLMTLARERAIATAYVVAGDEDMREGIAAAQDMGVRVVVVGVDGGEPNQAETLVHEADEHVVLGKEALAAFFSTPAAEPAATDVEIVRAVGKDVARSCSENVTKEQLAAMVTQWPRIPSELDADLLRDATRAVGELRDRFDLKRELRAAFWEGLSEAVAGAGGEPDTNGADGSRHSGIERSAAAESG
jgi:hypothetical protein